MARTAVIAVVAGTLLLAGCGSPGDRADANGAGAAAASNDASPSTPAASPIPAAVASKADTAPVSCATSIGAAAAARRVAICRDVSPATHPPCNAVNSCALIDDEIARSCALFAGDGKPMKGCTTDPKGMQAAADVVRRYYAAIDAHDYATAWSQWGDDGQPGQSYAGFVAGFAHTRSVTATIGPLTPGDGAAGSSYQPVPVAVDAVMDDGRRQHFAGRYIIRRVNDVDGASASQRRWHIDSARLR